MINDDYFLKLDTTKKIGKLLENFFNWIINGRGWVCIFIYTPLIIYMCVSLLSCDYEKIKREDEQKLLERINSAWYTFHTEEIPDNKIFTIKYILETCNMTSNIKNIYNIISELESNNWKKEPCSVYEDKQDESQEDNKREDI